jgi:hypothetical protein
VSINWLNTCLYDREYAPYQLIRQNMGATWRFAERINLGKSLPYPELTSSGFCLAQPNVSYLSWVETGAYLTINLRNTTGLFEVEWFNPLTLETRKASPVSGGDFVVLKPPFASEAVLFLQKKIN